MFHDALDALASLEVAGVRGNYAIDSVPAFLSRGQLPALLVLPVETSSIRERSLFHERGGGFEPLAFSSGNRTVTHAVVHLLLVAPAPSGAGLRSHMPVLVDLIDTYLAAMSADVLLGGRLLEPTQVRVDTDVFDYSGVAYVGCAFRHTWVMRL